MDRIITLWFEKMKIIFNDHDGQDSFYDKRHGSYIVWLGKKGNRETNKMHELAHINLGTDTDEAKSKCVKWISDYCLKEKVLPNDKACKLMADLFFSTWNVLEDERIESFSPRLFNKHKKEMGKTKTKKIAESNPVEALLCARFNRDDLVGKEVKQYIISSRLASKEKVYELAEDYIKKYLIEYIRNA